MDASRFDALTRLLVTGTSRRQVLTRLGGLLGAAPLLELGRGARAASGTAVCAAFCRQAFSPGPARGQCVAAAAHGTGPCRDCGADVARFRAGQCGGGPCPTGQTRCDGGCVDVRTNFANCGVCGHACPGIQDSACCGGACVRLFSDPANCGACDHVCPAGTTCQQSPAGMGAICV